MIANAVITTNENGLNKTITENVTKTQKELMSLVCTSLNSAS